ncbi:MAG: VWA domain-containing protein, partial [Candidatus Omnitrophica bacterium]|nr:VWA domain-containing protein [Candidatus Omnitrophota bacterium]
AAQPTTRKFIIFHNVDFLTPKVRAALHNFLLKEFVYYIDDSGNRVQLVLPNGAHIIMTYSSESEAEMENAFFNRLKRKTLRPPEGEKKRFSELEAFLVDSYEVDRSAARYIINIINGVMAIDQKRLWPSDTVYNFSIKDALALARYYRTALMENKKSGKAVSDNKVLCQEAYRLFGGALLDQVVAGTNDREVFIDLILKRCFPRKDLSILEPIMTIDTNGYLREMTSVPVTPLKGAQPIFEVEEDYRLNFVKTLMRVAGSVLRAWQPAWVDILLKGKIPVRPDIVIITGETGVAKTTLALNLALAIGVKPYVYSTHQGSKQYDLTADIAPDGRGNYIPRVKDFAILLERGYCLLVLDEGNIRAQIAQVLAPLARGENKITLVLPGEGRRLKKTLLAIAGSVYEREATERKLRQFGEELFGSYKKARVGDREVTYNELLEGYLKLSGDDERQQFLRNFADFSGSIRESGPIEINIGPGVLIMVTQNPESYAGRDAFDPVFVQDSRKVYAPAVVEKDERGSIIRSMMGILAPVLSSNSVAVSAAAFGMPGPGEVALRNMPGFARFGAKGSILDWIKTKWHGKAVEQKIALIHRNVAFFTGKDIAIKPGDGYTMREDGSVITIPYHELVYSEPDVITGSILHEMRHQRYTPSNTEFMLIVEDLERTGEVTAEEASRLRDIFKDRMMNTLFQLAENVRTDFIVEPGLEGENDYLQTFRKDQFMDNRLDKLEDEERAEMEKKLIEWAKDFPYQAFISELSNIGYFGEPSRLFAKYPDSLKRAVTGARDGFLKATNDASVRPDFSRVTSDEEFAAEKLRCAREYFRRIAKDVIPVYLEMLERSKEALERDRKKAVEAAEEYLGYVEPVVETSRGEDGEVIMKQTKEEAKRGQEAVAGFKRLERLIEDAGKLRKLSAKKKNKSSAEEFRDLQSMETLVDEARACVSGLVKMGLSESGRNEVYARRDKIMSEFNAMVDSFRKRCLEDLSKYPADSPTRAKLRDGIAKRMSQIGDLRNDSAVIMEKLGHNPSNSDITIAVQSLVRKQRRFDSMAAELANRVAGDKEMDEIRQAMKEIEEDIDKLDQIAGTRNKTASERTARAQQGQAQMVGELAAMDQELRSLGKAIGGNLLPDQMTEIQSRMAEDIMALQGMMSALSINGAPPEIMSKAQGIREKALEDLSELEGIKTQLSRDKSKTKTEDTELALSVMNDALETVQRLGDMSLAKQNLEDLVNIQKLAMQELAKAMEARMALAESGASETALKEASEVTSQILTQMDIINERIGAAARESQGQPGAAGEVPFLEELNKVRQSALRARQAYERIKARPETEEDVPIKDIKDQMAYLSVCMKEILESMHRIAYMGAPVNVLEEVYNVFGYVRGWADDLALMTRDKMSDRAEETKAEADKEFEELKDRYKKDADIVRGITPDTTLLVLNAVEQELMRFLAVLNEKCALLAGYGMDEKQLRSVLEMRTRASAALLDVEKILRERRMLLMRGTPTGQLEERIYAIMKKADEALKYAEQSMSDRKELMSRHAEIKQCFDVIMEMLISMYSMGTSMDIISETVAVRNNILFMADRVGEMEMNLMAEPVPQINKLIKELNDKSARTWHETKKKFGKMDGKEKPKHIDSILEASKELLEAVEKLMNYKASREDVQKTIFSRNDLFKLLDEFGLAVRDKTLQDMRTRDEKESKGAKGKGETGPNPEEELDKFLTDIKEKADNDMKLLLASHSREDSIKAMEKLSEHIKKIDGMIVMISMQGGREDFAARCVEARNYVWDYLKTVSLVVRKNADRMFVTPDSEIQKVLDDFIRITGEVREIEGKVSGISPPAQLAGLMMNMTEAVNAALEKFREWNALVQDVQGVSEMDRSTVEEANKALDSLGAKLREAVRAYNEMQPPEPGGGGQGGESGQGASGGAQMGGMSGMSGMAGMAGVGSAAGGAMSGGAGGDSGGSESGAGGAEASQGAQESAGGQDEAGGRDGGGASDGSGSGGMKGGGSKQGGKGRSSPVKLDQLLSPPEDSGVLEGMDVDRDPSRDKGEAEPKGPDAGDIDTGDSANKSFADEVVDNLLDQVKNNAAGKGGMRKWTNESKRARGEADKIVRRFKEKDKEMLEEEASSGVKISPQRYARGSTTPFDIDEEILGNLSLAFGLYVDNSGSMDAIKRYVACAAAYLVILFEGIKGTKTGKDKYAYGIKTFDTGAHSFKDYGDKLNKSEAEAIPDDIERTLGHGGTQIGMCINLATNDLKDRKEKTKVAIMITDGQDTVPPGYVEAAEKAGIILIGIGVGEYSANVRNIFKRYLIFSNPQTEIPDAITRLAGLLAVGKKLPIGDLAGICGLRSGTGIVSSASPDAGPGYSRGTGIRDSEDTYGREALAYFDISGSPLAMFSYLKQLEPSDSHDGISWDMILPYTTGRKGDCLSKGTVLRDLNTLHFLGLAGKDGKGEKARFRTKDLDPDAEATVMKILDKLGDRPKSEEKKTARMEIARYLAGFDANKFAAGILNAIDEARGSKEEKIIGIDTSWIPHEQLSRIQPLLNGLARLSKYGGTNIKFIRRNDPDRLAADILKYAKEQNVKLDNVVILGDKRGLRGDAAAFKDLREPADGSLGAFFAEVTMPADFPETGMIDIIYMLRKAMREAAKKDKTARAIDFFPVAAPLDLETLKELYASQLSILQSV